MSGAIPGPGFLLQKNDGLGNWTTIAEVKDITALPLTVDTVDVTNQSSPGGYQELVPTIRKSGVTAFDVNFLPYDGTHDYITGLQADLNAKNLRSWRMIIPGQSGGAKMPNWTGYVTGFEIKAPVAGVMTATVSITVTGQPTWV